MIFSRTFYAAWVARLVRQCQGATAVEYGLIAGLIGLGLVAALTGTRSSLRQDYACISTAVDTGTSTCGAAPAPTTALGYAMQMVPADRAVTGTTKDNLGRSFNWFAYSAGPPIKLGGSYDPSLSPPYYFDAKVVAANVWQITGYGGSPTVTAPGTVSYAMITPKGWIIVDTQAAP